MVILHIASINNNPCDGVCNAVPQHIISQSQLATIGFMNIRGINIDALSGSKVTVVPYRKQFHIQVLPHPFNKPDIVVFHECYRPEYLFIACDLVRSRVPYIIIPHGELREEAQRKKRVKKAVANALVFNKFIYHAAALQLLSEAESKATRFRCNSFIGTNGIKLPKKSKDHFNTDKVEFIYIGRYEWKVKGLDMLFEAIRQKADFLRMEKCHFHLYGPDILNRMSQVKKLIEDNEVADLITLHHEISGEAKEQALMDADIFVQTSRHEGMPMGILEAMGYGLPCLVTEGTTLGKQVAEAHIGWNAGFSANTIGEAIEASIRDRSKWGTMGCNAREYARQRFWCSTIAENTLQEYKGIIHKEQGQSI